MKYQKEIRMWNKNNFLFLIATVTFLFFSFFTTFGLAAEKPFIMIHNLINLTGIYASISAPYEKGGRDFLSWIADQGGLDIDGDGKGDVEVKYAWAEIGDSEAQWMSAYKRFRMGRARFSLIEMISYPKPRISVLEMWPPPTLNMLNMKEILEKDNVVGFGISLNDLQISPPSWIFADNGSNGEMVVGAIEYFIEHLWPNHCKEHKPRIAVVTWRKILDKGLVDQIKKYGISSKKYETIVEQYLSDTPSEEEILEGLSDFEKRGVNMIFLNAILPVQTTFMKTFHKLGLSKKMFLIGNPNSPPDDLLERVGPIIAEGYISPQSVFIPSAEPDEKGVRFARMLKERYRKEATYPTIFYIRGIRLKAMILESIRRSLIGMMKRDHIDLIKACKLINGKVINELGAQTLSGYSAYDTTIPFHGVPSGRDDRRLANHYRLIGIKNGRVNVLSPWIKAPYLFADVHLR